MFPLDIPLVFKLTATGISGREGEREGKHSFPPVHCGSCIVSKTFGRAKTFVDKCIFKGISFVLEKPKMETVAY